MNVGEKVSMQNTYSKIINHAIYQGGLSKTLEQIVKRKGLASQAHYDWLFNHWYQDVILMAMEVLNEK